MSEHPHSPLMPELPHDWIASPPTESDTEDIARMATAAKQRATGSGSVSADEVGMEVWGLGSWTRRQLVVRDGEGGDARLLAWVRVHDRAAGRTNIDLTLAPEATDRDELASALLAWCEEIAARIAVERGLGGTLIDVSVHSADEEYQRFLEAAGFDLTRTWLQMSRPVTPADRDLPAPREGTRVRRVAEHDDGTPVAADIQTVHLMLEESFADHFNSYRESFPEFLHRQREVPGHRWDHWWISEVEEDGTWLPGGAVVSSVLPADDSGVEGSYLDYIGVHRLARGRGVAKALIHAVVRDAAELGRNRVTLEVDADSPTGADGLYQAMGWSTSYRTQSWHKTVDVDGVDAPIPEARAYDEG